MIKNPVRNGKLRRYHQLLQHLLVAGNEPVLTFAIIFFAKDLWFIHVMVSIVQGPAIVAYGLWKSEKQQWLGEVLVMRDRVVTPLVICP